VSAESWSTPLPPYLDYDERVSSTVPPLQGVTVEYKSTLDNVVSFEIGAVSFFSRDFASEEGRHQRKVEVNMAAVSAARLGILEEVCSILGDGKQDFVDANDHTALSLASAYGHSDVVCELLKHGKVNVNERTNQGRPAFFFSSRIIETRQGQATQRLYGRAQTVTLILLVNL
jgi:hypothetical protein